MCSEREGRMEVAVWELVELAHFTLGLGGVGNDPPLSEVYNIVSDQLGQFQHVANGCRST